MSKALLGLAAPLDVPDHPSAEELLIAAQSARTLRLRLIQEHVRVTRAIARLQNGLDDEMDGDDGAAGGDENDPADEDYVAADARRRRTVMEGMLALEDPNALRRVDFLTLSELDVVRAVIVPNFVLHGNSDSAAATVEQGGTGGYFIEVMKLLAALTMPIPAGSEDLARQRDCLRRVRSLVAADDVLSFMVSAVAPVASSRLQGQLPKPALATIEVTLTLFGNLLKANLRDSELVIGAMCRSHSLELLLVVLRQNSAKLAEHLQAAHDASGDEGEREVIRGLMGPGHAAALAEEATSALAASIRGEDPASASRRPSDPITARWSEKASTVRSRDSHIPFPISPGRASNGWATSRASNVPSSNGAATSMGFQSAAATSAEPRSAGVESAQMPGTPERSHRPSRGAHHQAVDPVEAALRSPGKASPHRPHIEAERRMPASPMRRSQAAGTASGSSAQRPERDSVTSSIPPDPFAATLPGAAGSTMLDVAATLPPMDPDTDLQVTPADPAMLSVPRDDASVTATAATGKRASSAQTGVSPAPGTPALPESVRGDSMPQSAVEDNGATKPRDSRPSTLAEAVLAATPSRHWISASEPRRESSHNATSARDSDDDENIPEADEETKRAVRLDDVDEESEEDEEDGVDVYARADGEDAPESSSDDEDDDDDEPVYDENGQLRLREKDLRRDRVLQKLFEKEQMKTRGESMATLRRWNLLILEACALVFRCAPSATLATLGFGAEVTGSAVGAAKQAIAQRLASHAEETARWRELVRRRGGAMNSTALLVQRDAPTARLTSVGEADRTLKSRNELQALQEADARKKKKFRRKLLMQSADDSTTSLPLQAQLTLSQHYRQFAEYGFTNLSTMLWPELNTRVRELLDGISSSREAARAIKENNEGPVHNALDEIALGDVLNYASLASTMLRFGRITLRLRQATISGEASAVLGSEVSGTLELEQRERTALTLVDHALLPVAGEVLTASRMEDAFRLLEAMIESRELRKMYDYLTVVNFVAELLRVLVHSVDGDLADSEAVRLAATSLASSVAFNPMNMRAVLFASGLVEHPAASLKQVEATIRLLHATMLLMDRVSFNGRVQQEVRNVRGRRKGQEGDNLETQNVDETQVDLTAEPQAVDAGDDVVDATAEGEDAAVVRESTPKDQMTRGAPATVDDADIDAVLFGVSGTATAQDTAATAGALPALAGNAEAGGEVQPVHADDDNEGNDGGRREKPVEMSDFFNKMATEKRLAVFFHALRLWRSLSDDVVEGLVYFLRAFRDDDVHASPCFYCVHAIIPFSDILSAGKDAPTALHDVVLDYMRDFWTVGTTVEAALRCSRALFIMDQHDHWMYMNETQDPVCREVALKVGLARTAAGMVDPQADLGAMPEGYTMIDEDGNAVTTTFDGEVLAARAPRRRGAARRGARRGARAARSDEEDAVQDADAPEAAEELDEAELLNLSIQQATQHLGEEADPTAIFEMAETLMTQQRDEAAAARAAAKRVKRRRRVQVVEPAGDDDDADVPAAAADEEDDDAQTKKSKKSSSKRRSKKKHRDEAAASQSDFTGTQMLLDNNTSADVLAEAYAAAEAQELLHQQQEQQFSFLGADGRPKPKDEMTKEERKQYKREKRRRKEEKAARRAAREARRAAREEAGLPPEATQTQGFTQDMGSFTQALAADGSDSDSDDDLMTAAPTQAPSGLAGDAASQLAQHAAAADTLASFVASPDEAVAAAAANDEQPAIDEARFTGDSEEQ